MSHPERPATDDPPTRTGRIQREKFRATPEAEARILLLIDAFSQSRGALERSLEGRVKLAKLDFLLRYPSHLRRLLQGRRGVRITDLETLQTDTADEGPIDARMMRYRYGPWDPSYYAVLGSLIGRGLVQAVPLASRGGGFGYRSTATGTGLAAQLSSDGSFEEIAARARLLRRYLDLSGTTLRDLIYQLPEVTNANWYEEI